MIDGGELRLKFLINIDAHVVGARVFKFKYFCCRSWLDSASVNFVNMTDDESSSLTTWAIAHGCTFHSLQVTPHPLYGGYGLFNTALTKATAVEDERTALFIPNSLIISMDLVSEAAQESDELANVLNALPHHPNLEPIITVFLLYQVYLRRENRPGILSTYIENLPNSTLLPITWSEKEVQFLSWAGTSISRAVPAKLAFLKSVVRNSSTR